MTLRDKTRDWFEQYNDNLWRIVAPTAWRQQSQAQTLPGAEERPTQAALRIRVNDQLSSFAFAVIRRRPLLYVQWFRDSFLFGLEKLSGFPWIRWPALLLVLTTIVAWLGGRGGRGLDLPGPLVPIITLGVTFFLFHLALVSLVSVPYDRYMRSIVLLLPSSLCAVLFEAGRLVLRRRAV